MRYVDQCKPLPIDIGSPYLEDANFYIFGNFGYSKAYCFDTRIKAIEKIIEIEETLAQVRSVWYNCHYHKLPKRILVYWTHYDKKQILMRNDSGTVVTSKNIFNTELEAIDYAINHPDPIFLERKKELLKSG